MTSKNLLCIHHNDSLKTHSKTWNEAQGHLVIKQLIQCESSNCLSFAVIGYSVSIFSSYVILALGNSLSSTYDFRRHRRDITKVRLVLQNKLNWALLVCLHHSACSGNLQWRQSPFVFGFNNCQKINAVNSKEGKSLIIKK